MQKTNKPKENWLKVVIIYVPSVLDVSTKQCCKRGSEWTSEWYRLAVAVLHVHLGVSACLLSVTDSQVTELTSGSLTDIEGRMCQYVCVPDYYSHFIDLFIYLYMRAVGGERERENAKKSIWIHRKEGTKSLGRLDCYLAPNRAE